MGGIVDQIDDGVTGFLVQPADLDGFAARIVELLNDEDLAERIGRAGRDKIIDRFLADSHLREWLNLAGELLA